MHSKARQEKLKKIQEPLIANEDNEVLSEDGDKRQIDLNLSFKRAAEQVVTVDPDINVQTSVIQQSQDQARTQHSDTQINFEYEMSKVKKNFEHTVCSTKTEVGDVMFLDSQHVISLEFNHFSSDCEYISLEQENTDMSFSKIDDELAKYDDKQDKFRLRKFLPKSDYLACKSKDKFCVFFANDGDNEDNVVQYKRVSNSKNQSFLNNFMKKVNLSEEQMEARAKEIKRINRSKAKGQALKNVDTKLIENFESSFVEGTLALYSASSNGQMRRKDEIKLNMNRRFIESGNGNMVLTRSADLNLISVANFDKYDPEEKFFHVCAWTTQLIPWLPKVGTMEKLNKGLNQYYRKVVYQFKDLIELQFVGNCKFLKLEYMEKKLSTEELNQLMFKIFKYKKKDQPNDPVPQNQMDSGITRMAKKYVIFDVETGKVVFEYGGVSKKYYTGPNKKIAPLIDPSPTKDELKIFELSMQFKEIREEQFKAQLVFFYAGDFLNEELKRNETVNKWSINFIEVPVEDIFSQDFQEEGTQAMLNLIYERIHSKNESMKFNYQNQDCFTFDPSIILKQRSSWEQCIDLKVTRSFDQFSIISTPLTVSKDCQNCIYLNGSKIQQKRLNNQDPNQEMIQRPFFKKLPSQRQCEIKFCRNQQMKDDIMFCVSSNGVSKAFQLKADPNNLQGKSVDVVQVPFKNTSSQFDIQQEKIKSLKSSKVKAVFKSIQISESPTKIAILQTKVATSSQETLKISKVRRSFELSQQTTSSYPIIAKNLGDYRLELQSLLPKHQNQKFIIDLDDDESFVGFVSLNGIDDIGFDQQALKTECSSYIMYMTSSRSENGVEGNNVNLLLIDPFYEEIQVVRFKSEVKFENILKLKKDFLVKSFVQTRTARDGTKKLQVVSQFHDEIICTEIAEPNNIETDELDLDISDHKLIDAPQEFLPVEMIQDKSQNIYYATRTGNECHIVEISSKDGQHQRVFSLLTDAILGFHTFDGSSFFVLDEQFNVFKLKRSKSGSKLILMNQKVIREDYRENIKLDSFENLVISDLFIVIKDKIFFLNLQNSRGQLEAETLFEDSNQNMNQEVCQGPTFINGSQHFFIEFKIQIEGQLPAFFSQVFQMLDKTAKVLVNDSSNQVQSSTFLQNGNILLQCAQRFLVFNNSGDFITEANLVFRGSPLFSKKKDEAENSNKWSMFSSSKKQSLKKDEGPKKMSYEAFKLQQNFKKVFSTGMTQKHVNVNHFDHTFVQISQNNRFFVFFHKSAQKFAVFELVQFKNGKKEISKEKDEKPQIDNESENDDTQGSKYEFRFLYQLNTDDSDLFQYFFSNLQIDAYEFFLENSHLITITNEGQVVFLHTDWLDQSKLDQKELKLLKSKVNKQQPLPKKDQEEHEICILLAAFFNQSEADPKESEVRNLREFYNFPKVVTKEIKEINLQKINDKEKQFQTIQSKQNMLQEQKRTYQEMQQLQEEIAELIQWNEFPIKEINVKILLSQKENALVVFGGRFLKMLKLKEVKRQVAKKGQDFVNDFALEKLNGKVITDLDCDFKTNQQIVSVFETRQNLNDKKEMLFQFESFCWQTKVSKVFTWDMNTNLEVSMFQVLQDDRCSYKMMKGMSEKMNYFGNEDNVFDLDSKFPVVFQKSGQKQVRSSGLHQNNHTQNLNKVYFDKSRILSQHKAHLLKLGVSRIDVMKWKQIRDKKDLVSDFEDTLSVSDLNLTFSGQSLFHEFASEPSVLEYFYRLFTKHLQDGQQISNLPLQILIPDFKQQQTALDRAQDSKDPRTFAILIKFLNLVENQRLTGSMHNNIPQMVSMRQDSVIQFFQNVFFKPLGDNLQLSVNWATSKEFICFSTPSSIISKEMLEQSLGKQGILVQKSNLKEVAVSTSSTKDKFEKLNVLSSQEFNVTQKSQLTTVEVKFSDFDWLFHQQNAQNFFKLLASEGVDPQVLCSDGIQVLIEFMWQIYFPKIRNNLLLPHFIHLAMLFYTTSDYAEKFMTQLAENPHESLGEHIQQFMVCAYSLVCLLLILLTINLVRSLRMMCFRGLKNYFASIQNQVEVLSLVINGIFIYKFGENVHLEEEKTEVHIIQVIGSFALFLMWVKTFYLMQIFPKLGHYVRFFKQTLDDIGKFLGLYMIMIFAFASVFYIIDSDSTPLITDISGHKFIDSFFSVYLIGALDKFSIEDYHSNGEMMLTKYLIFGMFFLSTLLLTIIMLNMIIAILFKTFSDVNDTQEEDELSQKVRLIADNVHLVNIGKQLLGQRYIVCVKPLELESGGKEGVSMQVQGGDKDGQSEESLKIIERLDHLEKIMKLDQESQAQSSSDLKKQIGSINQKFLDLNQPIEQEDEPGSEIRQNYQPASEQDLAARGIGLILGVNEKINSCDFVPNEQNISDLAVSWIELCDTKGYGRMDPDQFYQSLQKTEMIDLNVQESEAIALFKMFDPESNGFLNEQQLVKGIKMVLKKQGSQGRIQRQNEANQIITGQIAGSERQRHGGINRGQNMSQL